LTDRTNGQAQSDNNTQVPSDGATAGLGTTLLRVAWLAILLGFMMEGVLLLLGAGLGDLFGLGPVVAGFVKNVSWSVFVCVGLAVGTAVSKARVQAMGLSGLLAAPLAFEVSRALHKGTLEALAASGGGSDGASPVLIVVVKALEYAALGIAIGWVGKRPWGGATAHAAAGLAVGLAFGGTILALTMGASPQPPFADLVTQGVNEVLFPVGCSLVLFSAGALGKQLGDRR
jgi:hypothetical protein